MVVVAEYRLFVSIHDGDNNLMHGKEGEYDSKKEIFVFPEVVF